MEKAIADYNGRGFRGAPVPHQEGTLHAHERQEVPRAHAVLRRPGVPEAAPSIVYAVTRGKARYNLDYYFVGDEGSLTSYADPYDFCWGQDALADVPQVAAGGYGNARGPQRRVEDIVQGLGRGDARSRPEEAIKSGNFAPWADHRTYMEIEFRERLPDSARRRRRGRSRRPHRGFGHAGDDRLQRLRLVPPRPGHRRLPLLRRRQPVGPAPVLRQAGRDDRLLDRLRLARHPGAERHLDRGDPQRAVPEHLLDALLPQPRLHVLAARRATWARPSRP